LDRAEIEAWARVAQPATVAAAAQAERDAASDWQVRIDDRGELRDLSSFAGNRQLSVPSIMAAAARAALELTIISAIWPYPLDGRSARERVR